MHTNLTLQSDIESLNTGYASMCRCIIHNSLYLQHMGPLKIITEERKPSSITIT